MFDIQLPCRRGEGIPPGLPDLDSSPVDPRRRFIPGWDGYHYLIPRLEPLGAGVVTPRGEKHLGAEMGLPPGAVVFGEAIWIRSTHLAGPSPFDCPDRYIMSLDGKGGGSTSPDTDGIDVVGLWQTALQAVLLRQGSRTPFEGQPQPQEGAVEALACGIHKGYGMEGFLKLVEHLRKTLGTNLIEPPGGLAQAR